MTSICRAATLTWVTAPEYEPAACGLCGQEFRQMIRATADDIVFGDRGVLRVLDENDAPEPASWQRAV